jgi:putative spermidine/putrescine transport system permease protein
MTSQLPFSRHPDALETVADSMAAHAAPSGRRRLFGSPAWWIVFIGGVVYFLLPLIGTFNYSLKSQPFLSAYTAIVDDPKFFSSLLYSFVIGLITIVVSIAIIVPTAFWVRLRVPRARPAVEFITLLPFVIPPIVLVFGLISTYSHPPLPFTHTDLGSSALLVAGYVVLSFPYMYRAVDTGLRAIDIQSLTEASQSLGAGWLRILVQVILPNLRVALLSGAFLTLAIVIGEFTMAIFLARPAFAPYLSLLGDSKPYQQAAVALISFGLTWIAMGFIALLGRGSRSRVTVAGAR